MKKSDDAALILQIRYVPNAVIQEHVIVPSCLGNKPCSHIAAKVSGCPCSHEALAKASGKALALQAVSHKVPEIVMLALWYHDRQRGAHHVDNMIASLEAKYGKQQSKASAGKRSKAKVAPEEPSEEAFAAISERLEANAAKSRSKGSHKAKQSN